MSACLFRQEYVGVVVRQTQEERRALEAWCWYYASTELYDRRMCNGPMGRDGILPASGRERSACERHALARRRDVLHALTGIDRDVVNRAQKAACALRFEVQEDVSRRAGLSLSPSPVTRSAAPQTSAPPSGSE